MQLWLTYNFSPTAFWHDRPEKVPAHEHCRGVECAMSNVEDDLLGFTLAVPCIPQRLALRAVGPVLEENTDVTYPFIQGFPRSEEERDPFPTQAVTLNEHT